jgi:hypothetical protein
MTDFPNTTNPHSARLGVSPTQGDEAMSMLNRRNALTAVATLPALAAPAAVAAMGSPDAELLALGVQLDAIISEVQAQARKDRHRTGVWEAACEAAGLPRLDINEVPREEFDAQHKARCELWYPEKAEHDASIDAESDEHGCSIVWNDIHGRLYPIVDAILSRRAQTVAGLAVQARAIVMGAADLWEPLGEEIERERVFIESVCAFVGVKPEQLLLLDQSAA